MFCRKNFAKHLVGKGKCFTFATVLKTAPRGGAVVARWAHNPKAGGSIPSPATRRENDSSLLFFIILLIYFGSSAKSWVRKKFS